MYSVDKDGNFIDCSRTLEETEAVIKDFQAFIEYLFVTNEEDEEATENDRKNVSTNCYGASLVANLYLDMKKRFFIMKDDDLLTKGKKINA